MLNEKTGETGIAFVVSKEGETLTKMRFWVF